MSKYEELKGKITDFVLKDDVCENEEIISAYTLVQALDEEFAELRNTRKDAPKIILVKANEALKAKYGLGKPFRKNSDGIELYDSASVFCDLRKRNTHISFFSNDNRNLGRIYKDFGDACLYYNPNDKVDDCVIDACIDDIYVTFGILEKFYNLFKESEVLDSLIEGNIIQKFSYNNLNFTLSYNSFGNVSFYVRFSDDQDPDKVQDRFWYSDRASIADILKEFSDEILKRFPIKISELDKLSQAVIKEYRKEKNKVKTMQ